MRILRLDLLAFGPFTDHSLSLDGCLPGLDIVYGANEAGKSSALRALRQLLYGIAHNSSDNFLHANPNLRIGARLEKSTGQLLDCIRRKGRRHTLRGADDRAVIDQEQLLEMLGGVDEQAFGQRFGIDYDQLVRGGQAIVQGQGDLGQILFAAGAGLADLRPVQERLAEEGQALFKSRGSVQRINAAVSQLAELRQTIKKAQLPTAQWAEHDQALRQALARNQQIERQLLEQGTQRRRLERIRDALPVIARHRHGRAQFESLATAPLLSEDFSESRREAVMQLQVAKTKQHMATQSMASLEKAIGALKVPERLLEHAGTIGRLKEELGSFRKAAQDRPALVTERDQIERDAGTILKELGRAQDLRAVDDLRVSRPERLRIGELGQQRSALVSEHQQAQQTVGLLAHEIERTEEQLDALQAVHEPGELRRMIRRVQKQGDLEHQVATLGSELKLSESQATVDLEKLPLWSATLEELEQLPVPVLETVQQFLEQQDALHGERIRLARHDQELRQELAELDQQIKQRQLQQDVPTEKDLERARQCRDELWQQVLRAWQQGEVTDMPPAREVQPSVSAGDLATTYEAGIAQADRIADRLRREADQVAEQAAHIAQREKQADRLQRLGQQQRAVEEHLLQSEQAWNEAWQETRIEPLAPRAMRTWIDRRAALVAAAESIRRQRAALTELEQRIAQLSAECRECLLRLDQPPVAADESLGALVARCEDVLLRLQADRDQLAVLQRDLVKLAEKRDRAKQLVLDAQAQRKDWCAAWGTTMRRLGLDEEASPAEAHSVLEAIGELNEKLAEAETLRARIDGIDDDADRFRASVRRVTDLVAGDLTPLEVDQAVTELHDRLTRAEKTQSRYEELQRQLHHAVAQREQARTQIVELESTLEALCQEAGCKSPQQLPAAEGRSAERKRLQEQLRQSEDHLLELAAGMELEEFIAAAEQVDADAIEPALRQGSEEIERLDRERQTVAETIGSERTELQRMDGSAQAAEARQQAEQLLARVRTDTRQYVRVHLAGIVLKRAIEQYREQNQGPVLERASSLFGQLTLGSFAGLRIDSNDKGDTVLVGIRAGGARVVGVEGMSEGTCDQLYLALRIASLETYLADHEPVPLIVDDILVQFDNDRSVAALRALAQLSKQTQVIFFTHHQHLVQLARDNLAAADYRTHALDYRLQQPGN